MLCFHDLVSALRAFLRCRGKTYGFIRPSLRPWPPVQNIWHSTLRSKKLKARSLLRAYAREVHERGDSAAARLEAFRSAVKLTKGAEDALPESSIPQDVLAGKPGAGSSDEKDEGEELDSESLRAYLQVVDSAEATQIAKLAILPQCLTGATRQGHSVMQKPT